MTVSEIFTLNNSIAPKLVRILYVIALVLIAIGVVAGVARGIRTLSDRPRITVVAPPPAAPPPQEQAAAPEATTPPSADAAAPPAAAPAQPAPQAQALPPRAQRMERTRLMRGDRFGPGPRAYNRVGRDASVLRGTFQIVRALVAGLIAVLVIRILAEMALAVLAMGEKAK